MERRSPSAVRLGAFLLVIVAIVAAIYLLTRTPSSGPGQEAVATGVLTSVPTTPSETESASASTAEVSATQVNTAPSSVEASSANISDTVAVTQTEPISVAQPQSPLAAPVTSALVSPLATPGTSAQISPLATPSTLPDGVSDVLADTPAVTSTIMPSATAEISSSVAPTVSDESVRDEVDSVETNIAAVIAASQAPRYRVEVVQSYPHDPEAFTQGLVWDDGVLYEGTGLHRRSSLRRVELETGKVLQIHRIGDQFFGEGIAIWGDRIYQLTWQSKVGFIYDKESFSQLSTFTYPTEGWGLTHDGERLIMSDGSSNLYFRDPETFAEIGRVRVMDGDKPITRLNELEYVEGEVFANVWQTDWIARIDPESGKIIGWIYLAGLLSSADRARPVDVLNGIAYDDANDRLFVTGKLWPKLFEVRVVGPVQP